MLEAAEAGVTTMYLTQGSANVFCGIGAVVKTWGRSFYDQVVNPAAGMKLAMFTSFTDDWRFAGPTGGESQAGLW